MKWCLSLIALVLTVTAHAKTILISDIDDTLKNSHVLNTQEMVTNTIFIDRAFRGLNWLYNGVAAEHADVKFFYVSNAQYDVMVDFHIAFLKLNKFPKGNLYLKKSFLDSNFKVEKIREIINTEKPDRVIAVGDNGEKDPEIYAQLQNEFPQIQFVTFIHQVYSVQSAEETGKRLEKNQIGFVSSVDLLLQFYSLNLVTPPFMKNFMNSFSVSFAQEEADDARVAIPRWADCRDFSWTVNDSVFAFSVEYATVKDKILQRCLRPAFND